MARTVAIKVLPLGYRVARRGLDLIVSSFMLLLLFPVMALVALAIRLDTSGPIFYRSTRVGLGGRHFQFLKFRTMVANAEQLKTHLQELNEHNDGPIFKAKADPRITKVGRILRKYSLDELPQFLHVFRGEMTLVGPRPPIPSEVAHYDDRCMQRLSVKPGLTCYWQVTGRSELSFSEWVDLDLKYIEEMGFFLDLALLAKTPFAVVRGRGAY